MNQNSYANIFLQVEPLLLSLLMTENIIRKGPLTLPLIIVPQVYLFEMIIFVIT